MDKVALHAIEEFFLGLGKLCSELEVTFARSTMDAPSLHQSLVSGVRSFRSLSELLVCQLPATPRADLRDTDEELKAQGSVDSMKPPRITLSQLHDAYLAEEHCDIVSSSRASRRATIRLFIEIAGDRPLCEYTREHAAEFRRLLPRLPKDAGRHFPGLSDLKAIEMAPPEVPKITKKTVNDRLSILSAFGKWLERTQAGFSAETFNLQRFKRPKTEKQVVHGFSDQEVAQILGCLAFSGCRSEKDQQSPGQHRIRDYRFWVPMLAAYTGARLNEITQLRLEDVVSVNGIICLNIADEHEAQSLKSRNARRLVPLHPALHEAGFLAYIESARTRGWQWIFEDVEQDRDSRRSLVAGKRFRVLLGRLGLKDSSRGGLHRFRHSMVDRLRQSGVEKFVIAALVGHESPDRSITDRYGTASRPNVWSLARAVFQVSYGSGAGA